MAHYKTKTGCQEAAMYRFGADTGNTTNVTCPPCEKPSMLRTAVVMTGAVLLANYISKRVKL